MCYTIESEVHAADVTGRSVPANGFKKYCNTLLGFKYQPLHLPAKANVNPMSFSSLCTALAYSEETPTLLTYANMVRAKSMHPPTPYKYPHTTRILSNSLFARTSPKPTEETTFKESDPYRYLITAN